MYHFFVEPDQVQENHVDIKGSDVNHIRNVLRMKQGETLMVCDGFGNEYLCRVDVFSENRVRAEIVEKRRVASELPSRIVLFQGLPKGDKMELIIQKAVELGASAVVPVASRRCVVKLDRKKADSRQKRWQAIAQSAAKQSGRAVIPTVCPVTDFADAVRQASKMDVCLIPYECAQELLADGAGTAMEQSRNVLAGIERGRSVGILIGPEGGFEKEEVASAMEAGAVPLTLGKRILRTETAGLCILSVLMFQLEE